MKRLLLIPLLLCLGCQSAVIFSAEALSVSNEPIAVARTNLKQTFIQGEAAFRYEAMTSAGIPIIADQVEAGKLLYHDSEADVTVVGPIGTPVPASVLALFPRVGELERYGIVVLEE